MLSNFVRRPKFEPAKWFTVIRVGGSLLSLSLPWHHTRWKLIEISWDFRLETQRNEYTRFRASLFQSSHYSPEILVIILYYHDSIQTLIWYPVAWASGAASTFNYSYFNTGVDSFLSLSPRNCGHTCIRRYPLAWSFLLCFPLTGHLIGCGKKLIFMRKF